MLLTHKNALLVPLEPGEHLQADLDGTLGYVCMTPPLIDLQAATAVLTVLLAAVTTHVLVGIVTLVLSSWPPPYVLHDSVPAATCAAVLQDGSRLAHYSAVTAQMHRAARSAQQ